jgi:hypothetical protein
MGNHGVSRGYPCGLPARLDALLPAEAALLLLKVREVDHAEELVPPGIRLFVSVLDEEVTSLDNLMT